MDEWAARRRCGRITRIEKIDSPFRPKYVLGQIYTTGIEPRRFLEKGWISPLRTTLKKEPATLVRPLPKRVRTILYHRLDERQKALLNGAGEEQAGHESATTDRQFSRRKSTALRLSHGSRIDF